MNLFSILHRRQPEPKGRVLELKVWPEFYDAIADGSKPFELRKDDRGYQVGDILVLSEFNPKIGQYTGRKVRKTVTYVLRNCPHFGLRSGYVILGMK